MGVTLDKIKALLGPLIIGEFGSLSTSIQGVRSLENPAPGHLLFLIDDKDLQKVLELKPTALLVSRRLTEKVRSAGVPCLISPNVMLAVSKIQKSFFAEVLKQEPALHPTAVIAKTAELGAGVVVGPYAVIEDGVRIGAGARIGAHCVVERRAQIGARTVLHPFVFIGWECILGSDCDIKPNTVIGGEGYGFAHDEEKGIHHRIPQMGKVVLEDRVEIGSICAIDRAAFHETRIGEGTKLDNKVHIAHNCRVGKNCLITAGLIIAGSSTIGDNVMTGGRVSVTDHVNIGSNIQLAGMTVITNDLQGPGTFGGYPVQPLREFLKTTASFTQLPQMRKQLSRILKHLGLSED